jgi:beta-glucosidase
MILMGEPGNDLPIYLDPSQPIAVRVQDLLSKMTREEKIAQLTQLSRKTFSSFVQRALFSVFEPDSRRFQISSVESCRKIPVLIGTSAIHAHALWAGVNTVPTQLGQSSSWDPDLIEAIGVATAKQHEHTRVHWTLAPVLCIAGDPHWGRFGETYGDDSFLIGLFALRLIKGLQENGIAACAQHYAGYSETLGGFDASEAELGIRKIQSFFLHPFKKVVKAGVSTIVTNYQSIDGVLICLNRLLLEKILRSECDFDGVVVTDYNNIRDLVERQNVCSDYESPSTAAMQSRNDLMLKGLEFYESALRALPT